MKFSQAVEGFLLFKHTLSQNTLAGYRVAFRKLQDYLNDPDIDAITADNIAAFMVYLRDTPQAVTRGVAPRVAAVLSGKSRRNIHVALSSLWTWTTENGYTKTHIMRHVARPKAEKRVVSELTKDDITRLLKACDTRTYTRNGKPITSKRATRLRDKAIISSSSATCRASARVLICVNAEIPLAIWVIVQPLAYNPCALCTASPPTMRASTVSLTGAPFLDTRISMLAVFFIASPLVLKISRLLKRYSGLDDFTRPLVKRQALFLLGSFLCIFGPCVTVTVTRGKPQQALQCRRRPVVTVQPCQARDIRPPIPHRLTVGGPRLPRDDRARGDPGL